MEIDKIIMFDDRCKIFDNTEQVKEFKEKVSEAIKEAKLNIQMDNNIKCYIYCKKNINNKDTQIIMKDNENDFVSHDWMGEVENKDYFNEIGNKSIIFCDYIWSKIDNENYQNFNQKIFENAKDINDLIFVCYSTIKWECAQEWVNKISEQEHKCKVITDALTFSYNFEDFIDSTKEAIIYEWKEI